MKAKTSPDQFNGIWTAPEEKPSENSVVRFLRNRIKALVDFVRGTDEAAEFSFKKQHEALPEADRSYKGKPRSWEEVLKALPDLPDFVTAVASLTAPEIYWINGQGQLVLGDGSAQPPEETRNFDYNESRVATIRVKGRTLMTEEEYLRKNKGQFDRDWQVWLESGEDATASVKTGSYITRFRQTGIWSRSPKTRDHETGSRRVVRVNLKFKD